MISRVLGLTRDHFQAVFFGTGPIAAAWEVLEKLNGRAVFHPITIKMYAPGDGVGIYAGFYGDKLAQAETLPRAVCLTALAAMEITDNA